MDAAEFADAVRNLVYLDLETGELSRESDRTYLSVRGPTDFAEQVTLLLDQHDIEREFATPDQVEAARELRDAWIRVPTQTAPTASVDHPPRETRSGFDHRA